jgi:hypothetical protein
VKLEASAWLQIFTFDVNGVERRIEERFLAQPEKDWVTVSVANSTLQHKGFNFTGVKIKVTPIVSSIDCRYSREELSRFAMFNFFALHRSQGFGEFLLCQPWPSNGTHLY